MLRTATLQMNGMRNQLGRARFGSEDGPGFVWWSCVSYATGPIVRSDLSLVEVSAFSYCNFSNERWMRSAALGKERLFLAGS